LIELRGEDMATVAVSLPAVAGFDRRPQAPQQTASLDFHVWLPRTRQCVFNAWTVPEYIELWSNTDQSPDMHAEVDLGRGTSLLIAQSNGTTLYRIEGSYITVHRPDRLVLTWSFHSSTWNWNSLIQVNFEDVTGGTMLELVQSPIGPTEHRELHARWWQDRLDRLMRLLS
jgi:uncharacterized protein YndB with AHSA1/START domain